MLTEQLTPTQATDLQDYYNASSPVICERKPGWITSLLLYFSFGVEATLLATVAERSTVDSDPISTNPVPHPVDSLNTRPIKNCQPQILETT